MIINKNTEEFYLLMNRKLVWKDLEILTIFHIKKIILFRLNMVVFIKVLVRLFIKGTELNPYKISEKNIEILEECWKKINIFKRNF